MTRSDCARAGATAMMRPFGLSWLVVLLFALPQGAFAAEDDDAGEGSVDDVMMQVVEDPDAGEGEFVDRIELPEPAREALSREPGAERGRAASEAARGRGEAAREAADAVRGSRRGRPEDPGAGPGGPGGGVAPDKPDAPGKPDNPGKPDSPGS